MNRNALELEHTAAFFSEGTNVNSPSLLVIDFHFGLISFSHWPKEWRENLSGWYMIYIMIHFQDQNSTALLWHINHAEIIVFCVNKRPVWYGFLADTRAIRYSIDIASVKINAVPRRQLWYNQTSIIQTFQIWTFICGAKFFSNNYCNGAKCFVEGNCRKCTFCNCHVSY